MDPLAIVAVLGTGPRACDIARWRASAGYAVRLYATDPGQLASAVERIRSALEHALRVGDLSHAVRQRALDGIVGTTDLDEAVSGAATVIDARD